MAALLASLSLLLATVPLGDAISCLVVRPGYGLISEVCPSGATGCRIRVLSDRIDWYEWAKLYDRNQLVCVYPEEYRSESGCQKKASGSVRCWCGGKDDCNDAATSRHLFETHIGPLNHKKTELASNRILTTTRATTTTADTTTTRRSTTKKTTPRIHTHTTKRTPITSTATTIKATTTTTTVPSTMTAAADKIFQEVNARPLPTDDRDKYDEIFDATRKALEAQMKEEDERLQQMLMDEEDEMDENEEEQEEREEQEQQTTVATTLSVENKMRYERRERARMEERRRQEEEERLARIEREEAEAAERKVNEKEELADEDYYEDGLMSSSSVPGLLTLSVLLLLLR